MSSLPWNLAAYCLQLAALTVVAMAATSLLRLRTPRLSWRFWQFVMVAALLLPLLQPRRDIGVPALFSAATTPLPTLAPFAAGTTLDWKLMVLTVVGAGVITRLLWLVVGLYRVRMMIAAAENTARLAPLADELNRSLRTNAVIKISDDLEGPVTVGFTTPVVLLPRSVLNMAAPVQRAILCHEFVHVRRRDWLHTIAEEIWCAALWFHPAARLIAARVSLARETVVDEITILLTRDRRAYAEALLAFADPPHVAGVTPLIGRRTLSQRIALIAEERPMSQKRAVATLLIATTVSASLTAAAVNRVPMSGATQDSTIYQPGPQSGVTLPQVVHEVKPQYTAAAMAQKIQGTVWLSCVVGAEGDVTDVSVTKSLDTDYGLDQAAMDAARQWKFKPGRKEGKPVAVRITIELTFTLKK